MKEQLLVSLTGTRQDLADALRRIADQVETGALAGEGLAGPFVVLDTSRPPISLAAVLRAEEAGMLDVFGEPEPWDAATESEGQSAGGL